MKRLLIVLAVMVAAVSCREEMTITREIKSSDEEQVELKFATKMVIERALWTKARNSVEVNEDEIKDVAIGIYDNNGRLVHADKVEGVFGGFTRPVKLNRFREYSCYVVTGYIAGKITFPEDEESLETLEIENTETGPDGEYDMTATLREFGPDRAGSVIRMLPEGLDRQDGAEDGVVTIPVESLWAKVSVTLDAEAIDKVRIGLSAGGSQCCGAPMGSRVFMPFAQAGGVNYSDRFARLPVETRTAGSGNMASEPFVFFVPENMLGDLLYGNDNPDDKTPVKVLEQKGRAEAQAAEKSAVTLTAPACADWGDTGTISFRFCLGDNTTSNFDIRRNTLYEVMVTATEDGYEIKDWKAQLDMTDSRSLSLCCLVRKDIHGRATIAEASFAEVKGGSIYLVPRYSVKEKDRTAENFDVSPGWHLTASCKEHLSSLGIDYSLTKKNIFMRRSDSSVQFSDDEEASEGTVYYGTAHVETDVLELIPRHGLQAGISFAVSVQTHDGRHSATAILHVKADGSVTVEWEHQPKYIAQQGRLRITSMTGSVSNVSFAVPERFRDCVEIDSGGDGCFVKVKRAGEVSVDYTGKDAFGTAVCTGSIPLTILPPVLRVGSSVCRLSADGTAVALSPAYYSAEGTRMSVSDSDADGYGDRFAPTLFNALLVPQLSLLPGEASPFLGCAGNQVYVVRLLSGSQSIAGILGHTFADALAFSAKDSPDIVPAKCSVMLKAPLGINSEEVKLGTIDNHVLTGLSTTHAGSIAISKGLSGKIPGVKFDVGASLSSITIPDSGDLAFKINADGSLTVSGKTDISSVSAGRKVLYAYCRNSRSGEVVSVPSGYIETYLHTKAVAVIDLNKSFPEVSTDITGTDVCPAFASLRDALANDRPAVKCSFFNGAFFSLGAGRWNYTDEFDSGGYQIKAPDQSGLLTVFTEANWPDMAKIGEVAYRIDVGSIEREARRYESLANFYAPGERPHLLLDFSGLATVKASPTKSGMFHYRYGQESDALGCSYYIIDQTTMVDWGL